MSSAKRDRPKFYLRGKLHIPASPDFSRKVQEILDRARRLIELEAKGFQYKRVWVKPTTVKAHRRSGYHVYRPTRGKKGG